ncbi:MAG: lytic transglycosylase domain-containing protein [Bdellovibrionales bacterium]|jgi:soluble lytic murein transglycosylase
MILFRRISFLLLTLLLLWPCDVHAKKKASPPPPVPPPLTYHSAFSALAEGHADKTRQMMAKGNDPILNKVLRGLLMAQPNNDYSFDDLAAFVTNNPDWPGLKGIMMILEQKIPSGATDAQLVNWFNAHPPLTPTAFYRYIDSLQAIGQAPKAQELVQARWVDRNFGNGDQASFFDRYAFMLNKTDHEVRLDRLLWENEMTAARAMYPYVDAAHKALAEARIALANQTSNAEALIAQVPSSLQNDAGLLYERVRWRRKNDNDDGALELLLNAPDDLGQPEKWWEERHIVIRRLMEAKNFATAYRLAARHGLKTGFNFVQAEFLAGWLALRFLDKPTLAHHHFTALLKECVTPISRARGYYWLGRTYEAAGQSGDAQQAYETAATLNTTFYGQLAITRLYAQPTIRAATEPTIPTAIRTRFFDRDVVRATERLYKAGQNDLARTFFKAITDNATQRVDFALTLELAYQLQRPDWAVSAAKAANQKNFIITGAAYPVLAMAMPRQPEAALTHALIRQESQFKADAGSPVGAQGLMQLMPTTAKDVAKKLGMPFSASRLTDPDYNVRLGTTFIQHQIDNFDGSYVLALAGYNAGPRRAREWMDTYGDPRTPNVDPIDWIELIPIYETRNYIQRIIENLQFYRARLNNSHAPLKILEDLKR